MGINPKTAKPRPWLRRFLQGVSLLLLTLAVAGVVYEHVEETVIARKNPPRGTLIDVGGRHMHLYCVGQGPVTVVFDSGLGGYSNDWSEVQPAVAKFARACSFDRAGFGWSDPGPMPRDSRSETADLHALLTKSGERGPFVLVGHSLGGLNSQLYALEFPDQVVGMVLVDSGHPEQWERLPPSPWDQGVVAQITRMRRLAPFGISRLLGACLDDNDVPIANCGRRLDSILAEFASVVASTHQVRDAFGTTLHTAPGATPPLGAKPLIVLSRDPSWGKVDPEELKRTWQVLQAELATLSSNSRRTIAAGSGHYIHMSQPRLVIEAISDVVSSVRSGTPLAHR